ncbi:unnamed protein product [Miscanthus lutarioriparius]|uniref:Uncharacterized protein n=1 Tax=Miscanthus lutarioriparius TaxID=422564 RepID=A0A811RPF8_9POAL|nr:unnamed protein product [Miscanthus lutarioriparius]
MESNRGGKNKICLEFAFTYGVALDKRRQIKKWNLPTGKEVTRTTREDEGTTADPPRTPFTATADPVVVEAVAAASGTGVIAGTTWRHRGEQPRDGAAADERAQQDQGGPARRAARVAGPRRREDALLHAAAQHRDDALLLACFTSFSVTVDGFIEFRCW